MAQFFTKIDLTKLFDWAYLTDPNPPGAFLYLWPLAGLFAVLLLGALGLGWACRRTPREATARWFGKLLTPLWTISIVGLLFVWFRFETIPYLSSRLALLIVAVVGWAWLAAVGVRIARRLPRELKSELARNEKNRYIPKQKRSR